MDYTNYTTEAWLVNVMCLFILVALLFLIYILYTIPKIIVSSNAKPAEDKQPIIGKDLSGGAYPLFSLSMRTRAGRRLTGKDSFILRSQYYGDMIITCIIHFQLKRNPKSKKSTRVPNLRRWQTPTLPLNRRQTDSPLRPVILIPNSYF